MRKHIVAGNWKMNMDLAQTQELISSLKLQLVKETDVEILIAPPFTNLYPAFEALRETPIKIAAQNMHQSDNGAFTGEISAKMLKSVGVKTVILGQCMLLFFQFSKTHPFNPTYLCHVTLNKKRKQ